MQGESQAIQRIPPLGNGSTLVPGAIDARCQTVSLSAGTSSTNNALGTGTQCFVTFVNIGTVETHIRFAVGTAGAATASDYPIPAGGKEEWWIQSEDHFSALNAASANLFWYRSST